MMIRTYTITAEVQGISAGRIDAVVDAIHRAANWEIPPEGWWIEEMAVSIESDAILRSGETRTDFARRLARSIWSANSGYCPISITLDHPHGVLAFDESEYRRLEGGQLSEARMAPQASLGAAPTTTCPT